MTLKKEFILIVRHDFFIFLLMLHTYENIKNPVSLVNKFHIECKTIENLLFINISSLLSLNDFTQRTEFYITNCQKSFNITIKIQCKN